MYTIIYDKSTLIVWGISHPRRTEEARLRQVDLDIVGLCEGRGGNPEDWGTIEVEDYEPGMWPHIAADGSVSWEVLVDEVSEEEARMEEIKAKLLTRSATLEEMNELMSLERGLG